MKTAIIKSNGVRDGTEERVTQNWAAEYAKRLVEKEAKERKDADNALNVKIDNHANERATGTKYSHVRLSDSVSSTLGTSNATAATPYAVKKAYDKGVEGVNAAAEVQADLNAEILNRQNADLVLQGKIDTEADERRAADEEAQRRLSHEVSMRLSGDSVLSAQIVDLYRLSHIHDNMDILNSITDERVKAWDSNVDFAEYKEYMKLTVFGIVNELKRLYTAIGVNHYDGGLFGMTYDEVALDGGSFGEEVSGVVDCGGFEAISLPLGM